MPVTFGPHERLFSTVVENESPDPLRDVLEGHFTVERIGIGTVHFALAQFVIFGVLRFKEEPEQIDEVQRTVAILYNQLSQLLAAPADVPAAVFGQFFTSTSISSVLCLT